MRIVQSESNNISLFSFLFLLNIMQKCRTIELSDYRAVGLTILIFLKTSTTVTLILNKYS